jgi:hypothetical protein
MGNEEHSRQNYGQIRANEGHSRQNYGHTSVDIGYSASKLHADTKVTLLNPVTDTRSLLVKQNNYLYSKALI